MRKNDAVYLRHILDAIIQIETYIAKVDYDQFLQERLIQDGVVRQLEIIGKQPAISPLNSASNILKHRGSK